MKIIVAPDSFKESLTAAQVCAAVTAGIRDATAGATVLGVPVADGGEGTVAAFARALDLPEHSTTVTGPRGGTVEAGWAGDGTTAIVELAAAAGIHLVDPADRDIWRAGTRGVGELLATALDGNPDRIIVGLGGSVTNDGGLGLLIALGLTAVDAAGRPVSPDAAGMRDAVGITGAVDPRWARTEVVIAGDVDSPLCGPEGAAAVFARQKGAAEEDIPSLDAALDHWAHVLADFTGHPVAEIRDIPGAGAAGGVGAALPAVLGARTASGAELLLDLVDFRGLCADADLVITGEGRIDGQTGHGKAPARVASAARAAHAAGADGAVPVLAVGGIVGEDARTLVPGTFTDLLQVSDPSVPLAENLDRAAENVRRAVAQWMTRWCGRENAQ